MNKLPLEILKDEKSPAIALLALITHKYGSECYEWEPEILRAEIENDFNVTLSDLQSDKIQAAITVLTTQLFEEQWESFETCSHLLNNQEDSFEDFSPMEAEELASALAHARLIVDGYDDRLVFSDEVRAYAGVIFFEYGMSNPPTIFPSALMPKSPNHVDTPEKDEALMDIYNERTRQIKEYMSKVQLN